MMIRNSTRHLGLLLILLLFSGAAAGQSTISPYRGDSVTVTTNEFRGEIRWQTSDDLSNWIDIEGEVGNSMLFYADSSTFYRSMILEGTCDPVFSDTIFLDVQSPAYNGTYWYRTENSELPIIGVHEDSSVLTVFKDTAAHQYAGVSYQSSVDSSPFFVLADENGFPTKAFFEAYIFIYENYTDSTVDVAIIDGNGDVQFARGIAIEHGGQDVRLYTKSAKGDFPWAQVMRWSGHALRLASCAASVATIAVPNPVSVGMAALTCTSFIAGVISDARDTDDPEIEKTYTNFGVGAGLVGCVSVGLGNWPGVFDCASLVVDKIGRILEDTEEEAHSRAGEMADAHFNMGQVAYYPFNGNANDAGENQLNAQVYGTSWEADRFGSANASSGFDGLNDYISIDQDEAFNTGTISVSCWIYSNMDISGPKGLIYKVNNTSSLNREFGLGAGDGQGNGFIYWETGDGNRIHNLKSETVILEGQWYHVVGVIKDRSYMRLYIDGVLESERSIDFNHATNSNEIVLGKVSSASSSSRYWNGNMDEVRIFSFALSPEEIRYLYREGGWKKMGSFTDHRDGNSYNWTKIGRQVWMAENLAYLPAVSGPNSGSYVDPHYYVYDYNGTDVAEAKALLIYGTHGVLYNYKASTDACPADWHLPTIEEWDELATFVSEDNGGYEKINGNDWRGVGSHLKSKSGWFVDEYNYDNGTDDYGFSAHPTGQRGHQFVNEPSWGDFMGGILTPDNAFVDAYWWSQTEYDDQQSWNTSLHFGPSFDIGHFLNSYGYSIRCIRD